MEHTAQVAHLQSLLLTLEGQLRQVMTVKKVIPDIGDGISLGLMLLDVTLIIGGFVLGSENQMSAVGKL